MNYPLIPLRPLIAEVEGDLKTIVATSQFNEEDMYIWAVDAMRQIGGNHYQPDEAYLTVSKHTAKLPRGFYLVENIWLCEPKTLVYTPQPLDADQEPFRWTKTKILRPAKGIAKFCSSKCLKPEATQRNQAYTIKCPPNIANFGFHTGKVYLQYLTLPMQDEEFMVQDEIHSLLAIKNYIKMMLLQEKYILQEVPRYIYKDFEDKWEKELNLAQQQQKFASPADTTYLAIKQDARFRRFNYKR